MIFRYCSASLSGVDHFVLSLAENFRLGRGHTSLSECESKFGNHQLVIKAPLVFSNLLSHL